MSVKARDKGFTIIELLISLAVFAFAIPAIAVSLRNLIALNNRARDIALVNTIAGNKAEQIRSAGFNSLSPGTYTFTNDLPAEIASPKSATYTVTTPSAGIAEVLITVTYKDYNKTRTQTYKTVVSELGVGQ